MTDTNISFSDEQLLHYSRQIMLPHFGIEGQQKLMEAHVLIVGLGGLGSPAAMYLAAAGIGTLTLVDFDHVDNSNLQRQIIHSTKTLGESKVDSACKTLQALNPDTEIIGINTRLAQQELESMLVNIDCVIDASDNFATRFGVNRACYTTKTPLVSAAAIQYEGHVSVFDMQDGDSACYACLYSEDGEENTNCSDNGILAPVVGIIGSMQALEAIKLIAGIGETLSNRLMIFDALSMQWRTMKLSRDNHCPVCKPDSSERKKVP